ncbi:MAG TPA: hypothetical protein ENH84_01525 [Phycisphaerae bacterium]|nr:hypothetical protein [Phycisphaerae bacterium]
MLDKTPKSVSLSWPQWVWDRLDSLAGRDPISRPARSKVALDLLMRLPEFADFAKAANGAPAPRAKGGG